MSLDTLYGPGTSEAFKARVSLTGLIPGAVATVTEFSPNENTVHVEVTWRDSAAGEAFIARWRLDFYRSHVHGAGLEVAAAYRSKGLYARLILKQPKWWRTLGIRAHTAEPQTPKAEYILSLGGFRWFEIEGEKVFAVLLRANGRFEEYREWLEAGSKPETEPAWHAELVANPVAGEEAL